MALSLSRSAFISRSAVLLLQLQYAYVTSSFMLINSGLLRAEVCLSASRGFGSSGGFGSSKPASKNQAKATSKKGTPQKSKPSGNVNSFQTAAERNPAEAKQILELYGGDIQQGTIRRISEARAELERSNPLLGEAMKLKEEKVRWERSIVGLGVLQQAEIPPELWEAERRRNRRLEELAQVCFAHLRFFIVCLV